MPNQRMSRFLFLPVAIAVLGAVAAAPARALPAQLEVMKGELQRNFKELKKEETPPYYMSYSIDQVRSQSVSASYGA